MKIDEKFIAQCFAELRDAQGQALALLTPTDRPRQTHRRPEKNDCSCETDAFNFIHSHRPRDAGTGSGAGRGDAASQAASRGRPSQIGRLFTAERTSAAREGLRAASSAISCAQSARMAGSMFDLSTMSYFAFRYVFSSCLCHSRPITSHKNACHLAGQNGSFNTTIPARGKQNHGNRTESAHHRRHQHRPVSDLACACLGEPGTRSGRLRAIRVEVGNSSAQRLAEPLCERGPGARAGVSGESSQHEQPLYLVRLISKFLATARLNSLFGSLRASAGDCSSRARRCGAARDEIASATARSITVISHRRIKARISNPAFRYVFSSCSGNGWLGLVQVGPVDVEVIGPQVAAGDCAVCGAFDGHALTNRYRLLAGHPIRYGRRPNAYGFRQPLRASTLRNYPCLKVHSLRIFSHGVSICQ